ncbi:unnamed protein product, partial [Coregonus sp. 'balchen']
MHRYWQHLQPASLQPRHTPREPGAIQRDAQTASSVDDGCLMEAKERCMNPGPKSDDSPARTVCERDVNDRPRVQLILISTTA